MDQFYTYQDRFPLISWFAFTHHPQNRFNGDNIIKSSFLPPNLFPSTRWHVELIQQISSFSLPQIPTGVFASNDAFEGE